MATSKSSKQTSIYVTDRTMSSIRPTDSISGRINQVVERYLEIYHQERTAVRADFTQEEFDILCDFYEPIMSSRTPIAAIAVVPMLLRSLEVTPVIAKKFLELSTADRFVLIELLEVGIANRSDLEVG